ncbi:MAG: hypothetical protein ACTHOJ_04205 [Sphingomonas oligoaromativorans]
MPKHSALLGLACVLVWSSAAVAGVPVPGFRELEGGYAKSGGTGEAERRLAEAIPAGTGVGDAQAMLIGAGATCRNEHRTPDVRHCLFHQYSLADGAADDIRWAVRLDAPGGHVRTVSVDRSVDRHGPN